MSTAYTLEVHIDEDQYRDLRRDGYRLCLAMRVNEVYSVVWSSKDFSLTNQYNWVEDYQISARFVDSTRVRTFVESSDRRHIKSGQTCGLKSDGKLDEATGKPDDSGIFHLENLCGLIEAGVYANLNGEYSPVFISPTTAPGRFDLNPTPIIKVWFDRKLRTGDIMTGSVSSCVEVSYLRNPGSQLVQYSRDGSWTIYQKPSS